MYQFIKPFLDSRMSIFEEYGDFKALFSLKKILVVFLFHHKYIYCGYPLEVPCKGKAITYVVGTH